MLGIKEDIVSNEGNLNYESKLFFDFVIHCSADEKPPKIFDIPEVFFIFRYYYFSIFNQKTSISNKINIPNIIFKNKS